jgi:hypothetical protein
MAPMKRLRSSQDDEEADDSDVESTLSNPRRDSVSLRSIFAKLVHANLLVEEESSSLERKLRQ